MVVISRIDVLKLGKGLQVWRGGEMVCLGWQVEANQLLGESDGQFVGNKKKAGVNGRSCSVWYGRVHRTRFEGKLCVWTLFRHIPFRASSWLP